MVSFSLQRYSQQQKISEQNLNHFFNLQKHDFQFISVLIHDSPQQNKIEHKREERKHKMSLCSWEVCRIVKKVFPKIQIQIFRLTFKTSFRCDRGIFFLIFLKIDVFFTFLFFSRSNYEKLFDVNILWF